MLFGSVLEAKTFCHSDEVMASEDHVTIHSDEGTALACTGGQLEEIWEDDKESVGSDESISVKITGTMVGKKKQRKEIPMAKACVVTVPVVNCYAADIPDVKLTNRLMGVLAARLPLTSRFSHLKRVRETLLG